MKHQIEGETIEAVDDWECEIEPGEVDEVPALKALEVDENLCEVVTILKTEDGRFFATWREHHPEMVSYDEFFPQDDVGRFSKRTPSRLKQFDELRRRMPSKHYAEEISRDDAYRIIAWFWLPKEFHADAGF
jgi:hypothetical protein